MKKLSEVITYVAGLTENEGLTQSMLDYANSDSCNRIHVDYYDCAVSDFHDAEGIYEFEFESNPIVERILGNIKSEARGLWNRSRNEDFDKLLNFFTGLTVEEISNRKTVDGQKLWKKISRTVKALEKSFHMAFENHFAVIEYFYNLDNNIPDDALGIYRQGVRQASHEIQVSLSWFRDLKLEIARLEKLDQQNKTAMMKETVYARLSFRRQDVLGMTHLGDFSSCQNLRDGFSDHAISLVGSLQSRDLGTLTIHKTMESATARDNLTNQNTIYCNSDLQAVARDNIIKDSYGNIIANESHYYDDSKYRSFLQSITEEFIEHGIFATDLESRPQLFSGDYDTTRTYELEGDIDFEVSGNIDMDDFLSTLACEDWNDETQEKLESGDLSTSEALELITELDRWDDLLEYVQDELDNVELTSYHYDMSVKGDSWREISVSDDTIMEHVYESDIVEEAKEYISNNWGMDDFESAFNYGLNVVVMSNVEVDFEDESSEYVSPYDEGRLSRWV